MKSSSLLSLIHDKTSVTIFSNNIGTWENLGNFQFIDHVGQCFYGISWITEQWQTRVNVMSTLLDQINEKPGNYPGATFCEKCLLNMRVRSELAAIHTSRNWFEYNVASFRANNRQNMKLIGITEKEVMDFADGMARDGELADDEPLDYIEHPISNPDSL